MPWTGGRKVIGMIMTGPETSTLVDQVRQAVAAVDEAIGASADRLAYRKEHGRQLSKAHSDALAALGERLDLLRERLAALLAPDIEKLYEEFTELQRRLGLEEVHNGIE